MKILGIDHIGIAVDNLERALEFYSAHFDLHPDGIRDRPDLGLRIACLQVGDVQLELIEARSWTDTTQRYLPHRGPGVYHVGLRVADVDAAANELQAAAVPMIDATPRAGDAMRISFIHPDGAQGALLELVTRTPLPPAK